MSADRIAHGGRLDAARRQYPDAPQPWIDLSTGVNPHAYPVGGIAREACTRLPDDDAFAACVEAARKAYGAPPQTAVLVGAGVQHFIQLLPRIFPSRRVNVLGFTYAEHAARWRACGAEIVTPETLDGVTREDVVVIVNPNNPDGRLLSPGEIAETAKRCRLLVIDESFMDFTPELSLAPLAFGNAIVLRSFGKAYGLPGLRLGFALCAPAHAAALRVALGPWAVSGPALAIGAKALSDLDWREDAARRCAQDAQRLNALLVASGFTTMGDVSLFRLAVHREAARWHARLAAHGLLTRIFPERPDWLRFGLPGDDAAWSRLATVLEAGLD